MNYNNLKKNDAEVYASMNRELKREKNNIELIASENFVSPAVLEAVGSILTNKYAEGYSGHRYYGGCKFVDEIETLAINRLKQLYGCEYANVQPHSGSNANEAVYFALLSPGDTVMGMSLSHGGHLTHGSKANLSGKIYNFVPYGVNVETETIDYDEVMKIAKECKPKLIVAGASAYPRIIDFKKFRAIADAVGAYLMVDMAHIAGLVAAGVHPSPFGYADVVTTTTHKTLRGPRGGVIMATAELGERIDKTIFPGFQGGPLEHVIAGKAVAFGEALKPEFKKYQEQIVKNAKAMADRFIENGIRLVSGGTDNHLMLLDLSEEKMTGLELENLLERANITVNKNTVPNEKRKPTITSGIRVGTPAITTRGMKERECIMIADMITDVIKNGRAALKSVKNQVRELVKNFPLPY